MPIKLLIADVDGTLVTRDKSLTPRTCDAVARLRAAGIGFTITSGRPPRGMSMLIAPLKLTAPVAAFNGGMFMKPDLRTVLAQRTIAPAVARQIVSYLLQAGLDVWVYQGIDWFVRRLDAPRVARESSNVGFGPTVIGDLDAVLEAPVKIVGVSMDPALLARSEAELNARLGADATAARSTSSYVDVTHPEANKGMVVREAARLLKIPLDQVATIGDMPNDLPMLALSRLSIAMGNAAAEVQRVARHITTSNEEEGFAHAVDCYILGEPPLARSALGLPPRARACLFGLDGVLTQNAHLYAEAWKQLFDDYLRQRAQGSDEPFVPFDAINDYSAHFHGKRAVEGVRSFLDSRGITLLDSTIQALVARMSEIMGGLLAREHIETFEGSVRYLRQARAAGLRTVAVTASRHCREILGAAGIWDLFDASIDGAFAATHALASKPAPDFFRAAAAAVGVDADEAVVFEDEIIGIEAGRAGHFGYVVGVDRGGGRAAELWRHGADVVVPDLAALLAA